MASRKKVRVKIDQAKIGIAIGRVGDQIERNLTAAALLVEGEAVRLVSRGQPVRRLPSGRLVGEDPSKPGEPPKVVNARLKQSINHRVERTPTKITAEIGSNIKYARALELGNPPNLKPRPYMRPALANTKRDVLRVLRRRGGV